MVAIKTEKMQDIGIKMEENNREVKDTLNSNLGLVQGLARNHTKTILIIVISAYHLGI
jgi:hypothetical protein